MPAMSGTSGRMDRRNSDNRKRRACITHWNTFSTCGSGRKTYGNARICVLFVRGMGVFELKYGRNVGFYSWKFGVAVGMQKGRASTMFLTLARSLLCVSVYIHKWINEHCNGLRVSGLQQAGGEGAPDRFWLMADGFPRKIFYFFRIFSNLPPFEYKCLVINNKCLSLKLRFSFRNWSLYIIYNIIGVLKIFCCAEGVKSHL